MAFPKNNRLRKSSLITLICKKGASWKTPFFRMRFLPSKSGSSQFCVVTSKKLDKRAVFRNKIRRRLSSALESAFQDVSLSLSKHMICVIFPTEKVLDSSFEEMVKTSSFSLQKINSILSKPSHGKHSRKPNTRNGSFKHNRKPNTRRVSEK